MSNRTIVESACGIEPVTCNLTRVKADDVAYLRFSYDVRGKHGNSPSHWKDQEVVQQRAYFRTETEPATLALHFVEERDAGHYRCRVDFKASPTRNTKVRLVVIGESRTRFDGKEKYIWRRTRTFSRWGGLITVFGYQQWASTHFPSGDVPRNSSLNGLKSRIKFRKVKGKYIFFYARFLIPSVPEETMH